MIKSGGGDHHDIYIFHDHVSQSCSFCYLRVHSPNSRNIFVYMKVLINVKTRLSRREPSGYPLAMSRQSTLQKAPTLNIYQQRPTGNTLNYAKRHSRSQVGDTTRRTNEKGHHPNRYKYGPPPPFSNSFGSLGLSSEPSVSTLLIAGLFCTLSGSNPGLDVRGISQSSE